MAEITVTSRFRANVVRQNFLREGNWNCCAR